MSSDVAIDLIKDVNTAFQKNCVKDRNISKLMEKLDAGEATYKDAYSFATSIGNARAKAFKSEITSNRLPDGKMYYNIGSRLLNNTLGEDYNLVAEYAQGVQEALNAQRGISLKSLKADKDNDRIKGFIDRLSGEEDYDKIAWILDEPVKVHALSVVDDTIQKNAEFQDKAGIGVKVVRIAEANCCKWCADLDGEYTYPGVKSEVFQRHDNCRCIVEYDGRKLSAYESKNGANTFREERDKMASDYMKRGNSKRWNGEPTEHSQKEIDDLKTYAAEKGIKLDKSFASFDGDIKLVEEFVDTMYENIRQIDPMSKKPITLAIKYNMSDDDYAVTDMATVTLNGNVFRSRDILELEYAKDVKEHWFTKDSTYHDIATHESAHVITNLNQLYYKDLGLKVFGGNTSMMTERIKANISGYAAVSNKELIAECYVMYKHGSDNEYVLKVLKGCGMI